MLFLAYRRVNKLIYKCDEISDLTMDFDLSRSCYFSQEDEHYAADFEKVDGQTITYKVRDNFDEDDVPVIKSVHYVEVTITARVVTLRIPKNSDNYKNAKFLKKSKFKNRNFENPKL